MTAFNFEQARYNMIEQQIRPWEVLDQRVLDTIACVPREDFVPERYRNLAFGDVAIPIGHGEFMLKPNVEGRLLQALAVRPTDRVLEVGTGSGYLTACLARLAGSVVSVDIVPDFIEVARQKLKAHRSSNAVAACRATPVAVGASGATMPSPSPARWPRSPTTGGKA